MPVTRRWPDQSSDAHRWRSGLRSHRQRRLWHWSQRQCHHCIRHRISHCCRDLSWWCHNRNCKRKRKCNIALLLAPILRQRGIAVEEVFWMCTGTYHASANRRSSDQAPILEHQDCLWVKDIHWLVCCVLCVCVCVLFVCFVSNRWHCLYHSCRFCCCCCSYCDEHVLQFDSHGGMLEIHHWVWVPFPFHCLIFFTCVFSLPFCSDCRYLLWILFAQSFSFDWVIFFFFWNGCRSCACALILALTWIQLK